MPTPTIRSCCRPSPLLRCLAAFSLAFAVPNVGVAQRQFDELQRTGWPGSTNGSNLMVSGDVDGDGDADLVVGEWAAPLRLLVNDGSGNFDDASATQLPAYSGVSRNPTSMCLVDLDGDGDLDLLVAFSWVGETWCYVNDGAGTFTDATATAGLSSGEALACGDVDGDGDLDLVATPGYLFLNDGAGVFTDVSAANLPPLGNEPRTIVLFDVDGDGDLDLVAGNGGAYSGQNRLLLNHGNGVFVDATATHMPAVLDTTLALAHGDVDGDGDPDLVVGNAENQYGSGYQNRLLLNQGAGVFVDAPVTHLRPDADNCQAVVLEDFDADGDLDLVFGNARYWLISGTCTFCPEPIPEQDRLCRNDGSGVFTDDPACLSTGADLTNSLLACDVNGDGHRDLVFSSAKTSRLQTNDGTGKFHDYGAAFSPSVPAVNQLGNAIGTRSIAIGDLDGDGYPDMVWGNGRPLPGGQSTFENYLLLNDRTGAFRRDPAGRLPGGSAFTNAVGLADVDSDGDLDVITGNGFFGGAQNRLYHNDGAAFFTDATATNLPVDNDVTRDLSIADIDGDGHCDLLFANDGTSRLYRNQGNGVFGDETANRFAAAGSATAIACGDLDGDGDVDVALGTNGQNRLLRNDGSGSFVDVTATHLPAFSDNTARLALADVDGDGDLDLVVANTGQNRIYRNDGAGSFSDVTATTLPVDSDPSRALQLADLDEDGDQDLVIANDGQNRIYENVGTGVFVDATTVHLPEDQDRTNGLALADIDLDGDHDIAFGNDFTASRLQYNLLRHAHAPGPLRLGGGNTIDVYSRGGQQALVLGAVFLGTIAATIPVPGLGTIGLDPSYAVALPPVLVPQPLGKNRVSFSLPANPAIAGLSLFGQALIAPGALPLRLSNAMAETIYP